ncbi:MAG: hypothetical protein LBC56_00980, partial [Oscillospiraceae bacterium]|nr:hypothetical protein [Oscillospiraceae bacterium]
MPEKSSVNISLQQMFDDYDYLWKVLDENYPYFNVALRAGVDMYSIRDEYRIKLNSLRTGQQFYSFMLSLSHKLNGQDAIGHLKML